MDKLISICAACYNNEKNIVKFIESVLLQSYNNFELIIVDDYSTDRSFDLVNSFKDKRIKIIENLTNVGLSESRKKAFQISSGEYVCFVDSDDELEPNYLQVLFEAIYKDNSDISVAGFEVIKKNNRTSHKPTKIIDGLTFYPKQVNSNFIYYSNIFYPSDSWNKLFKKDFIKNTISGFSTPKNLLGNDKLFNYINILSAPKVSTSTEIIYKHYYRKNSISQKFNDKYIDSQLHLISKLNRFSKDKKIYINDIENILIIHLLLYFSAGLNKHIKFTEYKYKVRKFFNYILEYLGHTKKKNLYIKRNFCSVKLKYYSFFANSIHFNYVLNKIINIK